MRKNYLSNEQILQDYGALFINLGKENPLSTEMKAYGYNNEKVATGKALYDKANELYLKNKKETAEETTVAMDYRNKIDQVKETYTSHRKKAKIIFKDQPDTLKKLAIAGSSPRNRAEFLKEVEIFYLNLDEDETLLNPLKIMKITSEEVKTQIQRLKEVQTAHANYLQEKGESQQATKDKDQAFANLEKWVREFYAIAKIALEDQPQLLESVAILVRS